MGRARSSRIRRPRPHSELDRIAKTRPFRPGQRCLGGAPRRLDKAGRRFGLGETKVTDDGLVHLSGMTELKSLSLDFLPITDKGAAHLRGLTKLKVLRFFQGL